MTSAAIRPDAFQDLSRTGVDWERRVEAMRNLLGDSTRRLLSLDDTRSGFESFGIEKYRSLSFYRRRL